MSTWERKEVIGNCTLYLGDSMKILPALDAVDAIITDPPYDEKTHSGAVLEGQGINFAPLESPARLAAMFLEKCAGWCLAFCALEQLAQYRDGAGACWVRAGIWDKITPMPQMTGDRPAQGGEGVAIFHRKGVKKWNGGGGRAAIWRHQVERGEKEHPTQKPLRLMAELVFQFSQEGQTVLDPFMGSGSTGAACVNQGRRFIGVEMNPAYFEVACRRIRDAHRQGDMFVQKAEA